MKIIDAYPHKAQYLLGEEVTLTVSFANSSDAPRPCALACEIACLDQTIRQVRAELILPPGEMEHVINLGTFDGPHGCGVDIRLLEGNTPAGTAHTAFDCVTHPRERMRYGFLSEFSASDDDTADVDWMRRMHINYVQFYDWAYRHHDLVSETDLYTDLMGKPNSLSTIRAKIDACHRYGMRALGYGAVYAAGRDFYERHPDWALRDDTGAPLVFIDTFYYMDIRRVCPWHDHIVGEYRRAVAFGFDGIHMDTYGFPKRALSDSTGERETVRLEEHFPALIGDTHTALAAIKDADLIFNCVGNWPVPETARSPLSALYIEVWPPYTRYHHIQSLIADARRVSDGRPVILAAYLAPFRTCADPGQAEAAALLLTAAIASCGASHLLVGEDGAALTQGYYADYTPLREAFAGTLRGYYDFIVRYGDILFDPGMRDVSLTHTDGDNREYVFSGAPTGPCGEAGKVWTVIRENGLLSSISFINLTGCDDAWNEPKVRPQATAGLTVEILLTGKIDRIFWASPEREGGRAVSCPYTTRNSAFGRYMTVDIPAFTLWGVLVVVNSNNT